MPRIKVWDGFIRFYHWTQLALLLALWWSAEFGYMDLHITIGLTLLALVVTRIIWGFIGSETAQFCAFIRAPRQVIHDVRLELSGQRVADVGHTSAGGYMIAALMGLIMVQLLTGLFASDDILSEGPLYGYVSEQTSAWLTRIHHMNINLLLALSALHIAVILLFTMQRRHLVGAMFSGFKSVDSHRPIRLRSGWLGFVLFVLILGGMLYSNPSMLEGFLEF
jgi:cytochrome b